MNGWEGYFRDGKFGKTNLFFGRCVLFISQNYRALDGTETVLEIPALCWVATDLVDYRK